MADRVGQQLGNYRLIRLLGHGGFAEVYLCAHVRLGTQAAVKVLHTRLASHDDVESFEKEARTVAHLKHPHIVRVLDYDVKEDTPFLVMDYAAGGTLRNQHPKGTRLSLTTIISYIKQVADALQYAHDQRVIHRDVKPENMLIGEHHEVLLSDFGIAIAAQSSRYQHTQNMGGTMAYIAPEQIQGHPRPASDQYSLGIVVYEWLSGNSPFHGSISEIVAQHLAASPPPLRGKVPTIASEVEEVILTALEKDPRKRFHSVKAFATALEQACQHTQASSELPGNPLLSSASVTASGELGLPAERSDAERASAPELPAFQAPLPSPFSVPPPPETHAESPAVLSYSSLLPTHPAPGQHWPGEPQTGEHTRREAPENVEKEAFPTPAPGSFRPGSLVVPSRRLFIPIISIVVVSVLLGAALLGNWIVSRELVRTPTPPPIASAILGNTPMPTPTHTPTATPVPAGSITEFPVPTSGSTPIGITRGPDGNLWFTEERGNKIGRITPNGSISEFPVPTSGSWPLEITVGSDGNLWFTEENGDKIGRITPNGSITEFLVPTHESYPDGITAGPDGNLWFTEYTGNKIGRITPNGSISEFPIPTSTSIPLGIVAGPDGNLWFVEEHGNKIGRITPNGSISEFSVPTSGSNPFGITAGPDGNLWFTEITSNKIGRITPNGSITEFSTPTSGSNPFGIAAGPDGNLWFTEVHVGQIGRITPDERFIEFPTSTSVSYPMGITAGPDGNLWFTEYNNDKIGRITSGR